MKNNEMKQKYQSKNVKKKKKKEKNYMSFKSTNQNLS